MPVVAVKPSGQMRGAVGGTGKDRAIGPLAQGGLDEALGLAVGPGGVGAGADMLEAEFAAGLGEGAGIEAGTVVGHDAPEPDAEVPVVGHRPAQKGHGADGLLVGQDGGVGQAGMVINGDKDVLPAVAPDGVAAVAGDAVAGAHDADKLLDVEMEEITWMGVLIAHDRCGRHQISPAAQAGVPQDARDGGAGKAGALGDVAAGELLPAQGDDFLLAQKRSEPMQSLGPRGAILQRGHAAGAVTGQPLGDGARANPEGRCCVLPGQPLLEHGGDHLSSTQRSENGMLMDVHGVASRGGSWFCTTPACTPQPHEQPIETSQLGTPYDLILMDIQMPEMDGIQAATLIRAEQIAASPAIIALTAEALENDEQRFLSNGFDGYLSKPLQVLKLKSVLLGTSRRPSG
jgi:CheY-like chemotaxis protein